MKSKEEENKFPGFPKEISANFWPYPRILNGYWHILLGSEQKILDYILRHLWGFNKISDHLSYSQLKFGIKKRDGTFLDKGCGVKSDSTINNGLKSLEAKGFIGIERQKGKDNRIFLRFFDVSPTSLKNGEVSLQKSKNTSSKSEDTIHIFQNKYNKYKKEQKVPKNCCENCECHNENGLCTKDGVFRPPLTSSTQCSDFEARRVEK